MPQTFNPYDAVNQSIQSFINTQMNIANLKRQQSLDEMNMAYHQRKMEAMDTELGVAREERDIKRRKGIALGEAAGELETKRTESLADYEAMTPEMKAYDLQSDTGKTIEKPTNEPLNIINVVDQAKKKALVSKDYPLYAELTAAGNKLSLEQANIQKATSEGIKHVFDAASKMNKIDSEVAKDIIVTGARNLGIELDRSKISMKTTADGIVHAKIQGYDVFQLPNGEVKIMEPKEPTTAEGALVKQGRIEEAMQFKKEVAREGATIRERVEEKKISSKEISDKVKSLQREIKSYDEYLKKYTYQKGGLFGSDKWIEVKGKQKITVGDDTVKEIENTQALRKSKQKELEQLRLQQSRNRSDNTNISKSHEAAVKEVDEYIQKNKGKTAKYKGKELIIGNKYTVEDDKGTRIQATFGGLDERGEPIFRK